MGQSINILFLFLFHPPAKILSPNKTKNVFHNETVILNYIGSDPFSLILSN